MVKGAKYLLHAELAQAVLSLGNDRVLGGGLDWVGPTWHLCANGEVRRELEVAQVSLRLLIGGRGVNVGDETVGLVVQQNIEPWLDVLGRAVAVLLGEEAGAKDKLGCSHGVGFLDFRLIAQRW